MSSSEIYKACCYLKNMDSSALIKPLPSTELSDSHKIHVIAFDYGGVLFSNGKELGLDKLELDYGYDRNIVWQLLNSPESWELRRGNISDDAFWTWAQTQLPKGYDACLIRDTWYSMYILDENILNLLQRLKQQNYRIIAYTDNIPERVAYLENKYHFQHYFDAEVKSYDWHAVKTDITFAQALLKIAGCETDPATLVHIDDQILDVEHVKKLGGNVLIYRTGYINELITDLHNIGVQC
ncbi:unnamed protein product [Adineta steineri]|uniref:Uncharacterized protein n=3 Tax=Adineta steineri TaxID=433720 RepID=A0A819EFZ6_9BILA|nr:unnamed protein product [Adineta steineri]